MKSFKNLTFIAAGVIVLSTVLSVTGLGRAAAATVSDVFITNTPAHPVPVSGAVNAIGTTRVVYTTPPGSLTVSGCKTLVDADVSAYSQVRVYFETRFGSDPNTTLYLDPHLAGGAVLPSGLDSIILGPNGRATRVYDTPGTRLYMDVCSRTTSYVDVWVYGR